MALFGAFKRYPTPIVKPLWPFFTAAVGITYLFSAGANASMNSAEFINDPRHPRFAAGGKVENEKH